MIYYIDNYDRLQIVYHLGRKVMRIKSLVASLIILAMLAPFHYADAADVVKQKKEYSYEMVKRDLIALEKSYPDLVELKTIGKTEYGREIYAISVGKGTPTAFVNASHHAREHFTTAIVMNQIQDLLTRSETEDKVNTLLDHVTLWFVPMVNADGVTLVQQGVSAFPEADRKAILAMNDGKTDFSRWKANAKGIDLNRQYPADWANIKSNPGKKYYANYKGSSPLQTKENQAIMTFTYEINPQMTMSYHSSGQVIYWNFHNDESVIARDTKLARQLAQITGYKLMTPTTNPSGGGYSDWFIQTFKRPAYTPELATSSGERPVKLNQFAEEWKRNKEVPIWLAENAYILWRDEVQSKLIEEEVEITLTEKTKIYHSMNKSDSAYSTISPTTIKSTAHWDKWYLVETWLGEKYIYVADAEIVTPVKTVNITKSTKMHAIPYENSNVKGYLSPQTIKVITQTGNWSKVNTWLGEVWIQVK